MKRYADFNVCFNFFVDPDRECDEEDEFDRGRSSVCDYDIYIIFCSAFCENELIRNIDITEKAEEAVYKIVSNKEYTDDTVIEKIRSSVNALYSGDDPVIDLNPVIDVIIKKRKFPVESIETGRNEVSMEG